MRYKIHRLCRDNDTVRRLRKEGESFNLPPSEYVTGIDLFTFINNIIDECPDDYALIVHDDVILPMNISDNIKNCIDFANSFLGEDKWGLIGNAGVEVFTKKVLLYLSDPNLKMIVPSTEHPELVESIDGNTMLLNLKNLRKKKVRLPETLSGFHLYDLILSFETQKNNLVCAVSSLLYCRHSSGGSREEFKKTLEKKIFQDYFSQNYSDKVLSSINGDIPINHHTETNKTQELEKIIQDNVLRIFKEKSFNLYFIIELDKGSVEIFRLLESIKIFKNQTSNEINVKIGFIISENTKEKKVLIEKIETKYKSQEIISIHIENRQEYFLRLSESIPLDNNTYISIIKNDYIILPDWALYIQYFLSSSDIIISRNNRSVDSDQTGSFNQRLFSGNPEDPYTQAASLIFNSTLLKSVAQKGLVAPEDLENYIIFLCFAKYKNPKIVNLPFYKTPESSLQNKSELTYKYVTVMSKLVNEDLVPLNYFNFFSEREDYWYRVVDQLSFELDIYKQSLIWKIAKKYGKIKKILTKRN